MSQTMDKLEKHYEVKKWFTNFHCGYTNTYDAEHSGRPTEVSTPETIKIPRYSVG